ncbi:uncharacterized protein BKA78DRAFT_300809 [Phyllosticta capitalensis]|uniref:uncharacterized protein n=1 Tax=Phyllosticta capitalensis TaxID=121624 RepID=UPI0031300AE8
MSSRNFTFDIFTDGVRVMDEDRQLKQPDEIETRAPCAIDRRACTYHRGRSNEPALLPTPAPVRFTSWVSRLKAKAREVVSSFKGQPQQNVNLAIICADFRFPALKSSKCFLRSTAPCCLLLKVNVYWRDADEQANFWGYMNEIGAFFCMLAHHGTVKFDITFKITLESRQLELGGCEEYLKGALGAEGLRSTLARHVDFTIEVEHLHWRTIKIYRFKGVREDTMAEFRGQTTYIMMGIAQLLGLDDGMVGFAG